MTKSNIASPFREEFPSGVAYVVSAFLIWGMAPLYIRLLKPVPVFEIVIHRVVWSCLFLLAVLAYQRRWDEMVEAVTDTRTLLVLLSSTAMLGVNWFMVNWAVVSDHVLQISMAYYVSPLLSLFLGVVFLGERLSVPQIGAVLMALGGVLCLVFQHSDFLWVSGVIALSFVLYTLIRKLSPVKPLVGLCVETSILTVPSAVYYLMYLNTATGTGSLFMADIKISLLLGGTFLITAFPLLFLVTGTKRVSLSFTGILQYIMPTCAFFLAVSVFQEPFVREQLYAFALIWIAVILYSADSVLSQKRG